MAASTAAIASVSPSEMSITTGERSLFPFFFREDGTFRELSFLAGFLVFLVRLDGLVTSSSELRVTISSSDSSTTRFLVLVGDATIETSSSSLSLIIISSE
jgi:hypothetical protein